MNLWKELYLIESEKISNQEIQHVIDIVNKIYNEWKKTKRRINAVDIITTTANKLSNISPEIINKIHEATKMKLAILLMRCLDPPPWKPLEEKKKIYKKLFPLIKKLETYNLDTGTGGNLRDIIFTRLSSSICYNNKINDKIVFVGYESKITPKYLKYLLSDNKPIKTFKMQSMPFPDDFESLIKTLTLNHEKSVNKFKKSKD